MGTISRNFSYKEFEVTDNPYFATENVIKTYEVRDNVKSLVLKVLQPLRDAWGKSLYINSGYRCPALNRAVGGVSTSQHVLGQAADVCPFGKRNGTGDIETIRLLASTARALGLPYDQMILYPSFVHFSYRSFGINRGQILYAKSYKGRHI